MFGVALHSEKEAAFTSKAIAIVAPACAPLKRCMMDATAAHICTNTLDESAATPKYTLDVHLLCSAAIIAQASCNWLNSFYLQLQWSELSKAYLVEQCEQLFIPHK